MLSQVAGFPSILWLINTLPCKHTTFSLFMHPFMEGCLHTLAIVEIHR